MAFKSDSLNILNQLIGYQNSISLPTGRSEKRYTKTLLFTLCYITGEPSEVIANGMAARLHSRYEDLAKQISYYFQKKVFLICLIL